ncbi:MAG: hypothetical protein ACRDI2_12630 [Chloroflexota bacterium]
MKRPLLALAVALVAVRLGAWIVNRPAVIALVVPMMLAVLLLIVLVRSVADGAAGPTGFDRLLRWTLGAFVAHLMLGLLVTNLGGVARYLGGDHFTYHELAKAIANHWADGSQMPHLPAGKEGYYYILAVLYWVFGGYTHSGLVLNAALSAALVPIVSDTARRLFGRESVRYVPQLVVLLPGMFLWTSQLLKEAPIIFLVALAANLGARLAERVTVALLCGFSLTAAVLLTVRGYIGLAVAASILGALILGRGSLVRGVAPAGAAAAILAVLVLSVGLGRGGYEATVSTDLGRVNVVRLEQARAGASGFGEDVDVSTPQRAISFLPIGTIQFVLGPFPWQIGSLRQLPALPDVVVWWALLPSLFRGHRAGRPLAGRRILLLELPALAATLPLALLIGNFGTVARERTQVIVLVIPLIALGLTQRAARRQEVAGPAGATHRPLAATST